MDAEHKSAEVQSMLEGLENYLTAHCVAQGRRAIVIVRDDEGFAFRRSIGEHGVTPIPESFDDALIVQRFALQTEGSDADLLAMDATIAAAQLDGDRVVILPPAAGGVDQDAEAAKNRAALYGQPAAAASKPRIVLALDNEGYDALYIDGKLVVRDHSLYAGQVIPVIGKHCDISYEYIEVDIPDGEDFPPTLAEARKLEIKTDGPTVADAGVW